MTNAESLYSLVTSSQEPGRRRVNIQRFSNPLKIEERDSPTFYVAKRDSQRFHAAKRFSNCEVLRESSRQARIQGEGGIWGTNPANPGWKMDILHIARVFRAFLEFVTSQIRNLL